MKLRLALFATMWTVVGLSACSDPISLTASGATSVDTLSVFALSGTPPAYPNALSIPARQTVPVNGFGGFDVAFDIDAANNVVIYPVRLIVSLGGAVPQVGMQKVAGTFENIDAAPTTGYKVDSALVVSPGEVVVIEAAHNQDRDICQFALSPNLYAKISIDSVFPATRTIKFRMGFDPNCGFRSFAAGIPTS